MSALTKFQTNMQTLMLLQTDWIKKLNPVLALPIVQGTQLTGISLVANTPKVINTLLGKKQQGYIVTDQNANASIWRTQPFNDITLTLESSANVTIDLWVY